MVQTVDADGSIRAAPSATPVYLPLALVIEKGREAYLAGRLAAQTGAGVCAYRAPDGSPCVIGAALDDATALRFDDDEILSGVHALIRKGLLTTDDEASLGALQRAHDAWVKLPGGDGHASLRRLLGLSDGTPLSSQDEDEAQPNGMNKDPSP